MSFGSLNLQQNVHISHVYQDEDKWKKCPEKILFLLSIMKKKWKKSTDIWKVFQSKNGWIDCEIEIRIEVYV